MKESRTSKALSSSFKSKNIVAGGYVGSHIKITNNQLKEDLNHEKELRNEVQITIKNMIMQKKSAEEIRKTLNQDKYKAYEQYLDIWIQGWIIKLNPDIKSILTKGLKQNKQAQEIIEAMQNANNEMYKLYETQIQSKIRNEIESREKNKKQGIEKQEEER